MQIGILALQGAFIEHYKMLKSLNVEAFEIRQKKDLDKPMDGIILPGGESTTMYKLLKDLDMFDIVKEKIENGLPVFGTCAGLLLLAKKVNNHSTSYIQTMDIVAKKNAYGRQLGSFRTYGTFNNKENVPFVFIRAPFIESVGEDVEVLSIVDDMIVAARQGNQLATAFHPELTDDLTIHQYFISLIENNKKTS
ncbi:pyridoxal 5'-phosphate synthase glutaminase subunit PdxT [Candidatus Izemoplasma sp. B36]|uniref:pyridoxal 5'-phosphate synthase glutaminase subunit PdxT n=1 Tax=Candidatus Izemoplasma sp. B36 TaxID=3242468 RepID=UPI003557EC7F